MLSRNDILETIRMIDQQHLDIRTITMGISLLSCADSSAERACEKIYDKISRYAERLVATGEEIEREFGKQYFVSIDLQKKLFCEANIPLRQQESRLTNEYQKIMATAEIPFDGKTLNLYGVQKYFEHPDRAVRAAAVKAYSNFYESNEPRLEEIWDELIRIRNQMGKNLGYENYIPVGYLEQSRTDYGEKEVASFREQVRTVLVPLCRKLYDAQARRLGIDHVMWHDEKMVFPDGNAEPAGDDEFMVKTAQKMYHEISPETGEFIDFMIDHELMDLQNKPGKASTGYMTSLPSLKAPFVFSCFNHTIFDMQVLTHELGHAFAGYMAMRSQPISDYYSESTDIAEIHSMSMEFFAWPWAGDFFGDQQDKFRYKHLSDAEFANFRNVATTGMGKNLLYRGSSPINPELGRNGYADAALKKAGVTVIMNLADSEADAKAYEGFADTYYAGQKVIYLNLGVDFTAPEFQAGLADGLRFFAANKGVYYVHCTEGKDRAGFVNALLECLMGATFNEVVEDYMTTYYNYYGVEPGSDKYTAIAESNIIKTLQTAFGVEDLSKADLQKGAKDYMKAIGLTDAEITSLMTNLGYKAPATGDTGVVLYVGLAVLALTGGVFVARRKELF